MTDMRSLILKLTPNFIDYALLPKDRLSTYPSDDDLSAFFSSFEWPKIVDDATFRIVNYGIWSNKFDPSAFNEVQIAQWSEKLLRAVATLEPISDVDLNERLTWEIGDRHIARTPDEGWAMVALNAALQIAPRLLDEAAGDDPSGIVARWSLATYIDGPERLGLVGKLAATPQTRQAAVRHIEALLESGGLTPAVPDDAKTAIRALDSETAAPILGALLAHFVIRARNAQVQGPLQLFFQNRLTFLADEVRERLGTEENVADFLASAPHAEVEAVAFIGSSLAGGSVEATQAVVTRASSMLSETFAVVEDVDAADGYLHVESFYAYVEVATMLPLDPAMFEDLFSNLQCDRLAQRLDLRAYWRDRIRAIVFCAIALFVAEHRGDATLRDAAKIRVEFLTALPAGRSAPFSDEFATFLDERFQVFFPRQ